jgi:hypothetical protein
MGSLQLDRVRMRAHPHPPSTHPLSSIALLATEDHSALVFEIWRGRFGSTKAFLERRLLAFSYGTFEMRQFTLILLLIVCGCTKTVTKATLDAKAIEHVGFTFPDQAYYVGSDTGYDYFVIRPGLGGSTQRYRILQSQGAVTNRFSVTKDETLWHRYGLTAITVTNSPRTLPKWKRSLQFISSCAENATR